MNKQQRDDKRTEAGGVMTLNLDQADALLQRCEQAYAEQCRRFVNHHTMPADQDAIKWAA